MSAFDPEAAAVGAPAIVTWDELSRQCDAVSARLRATGVPPAGVVAVDGSASLEAAASILGIVRAGAVAAPLAAGMTEAETGAMLALIDPVLVFGRDDVARPGRVLDGAGVVVLTSGTTARPKGVVLSARALEVSAESWLAALPPATGWLLAVGLAHVAGIGVLWRAKAARVPVCIVAPGDPAAQLQALRATPTVSHVSLVPAQLARLLDACADAGAAADAAGRPAGRRDDPGGARHAGARRGLARGPDVRPE